MSFVKNPKVQQLNLLDSASNLTSREHKFLENSWAMYFSEEIFPLIDENIFAVLYSENKASRPNTPVNVLFGAAILQELNCLNDEEIVEALMFDVRYQVALHTTSFAEQPLSDKSMQRFRNRCMEYEKRTGIDLIHDCVKSISKELAHLSGISGTLKRMDSMMIAANIRNLSRLELLYRCVADVVNHVYKVCKSNGEAVPKMLLKGLEHYHQADDRNRVIYHNADNWQQKIAPIIRDGNRLVKTLPKKYRNEAYEHLVRAINEQTVIDKKTGKRRLKTKEDGKLTGLMQSPYDDEATYREKAGKKYKGYVGNFEESVSVDENGKAAASIITDYDLQPNTYSDKKFLEDNIEPAEATDSERITIVADGGYGDETLREKAAAKGIDIVNTNLTGKDTNGFYSFISLSENGTRIQQCMKGKTPESCQYNEKTGKITAYMNRSFCESCPHKNVCGVKFLKSKAKLSVSKKQVSRAKQQLNSHLDKFKKLGRLRNGVESIPSFLRNSAHVDKMPVRGRLRMKQRLGFKVLTLNIQKRRRKIRQDKCTQNQGLAA